MTVTFAPRLSVLDVEEGLAPRFAVAGSGASCHVGCRSCFCGDAPNPTIP